MAVYVIKASKESLYSWSASKVESYNVTRLWEHPLTPFVIFRVPPTLKGRGFVTQRCDLQEVGVMEWDVAP